MAATNNESAMTRAVELARTPDFVGGGNPRVGCVLLDQAGSVLAQGWHGGAGTDHAEVMALRRAGAAARGATAVVTLEPCAHTGRTGPCVAALISAGVRRVIFAQADPDPVAAGGARRLREAGIEVIGPTGLAAALELNQRWTVAVARGRPYVILKLATTLDGRVAAADGSSRWVTGPQARAQGHRLRAEVDAVLVGTGTVLVDDPQLTARDEFEPRVQPLRVVVGYRDIARAARINDDQATTIQLRTHDLNQALAQLFDRGVRSVLVEGGRTIATSLLVRELVDRLDWFIAPALLGDTGLPAIGDLGIAGIAGALRWSVTSNRILGADTYLQLRPADQAGTVGATSVNRAGRGEHSAPRAT